MSEAAALAALAWGGFLAATILPASSEVALGAMIAAGVAAPWKLVAAASLGNVAGAVVNWGLGRGVARFRERRWFPVSASALARAEAWYARFGVWSLLFAWVPVVGDPLTVAAGIVRTPLVAFLPLVAIGKVARYVVIAAAAGG